ncbi:MAG: hypothetical protein WC707_01160 [Candidatus Babeliaceae bacterium]|jgi:WD40 repeat protein
MPKHFLNKFIVLALSLTFFIRSMETNDYQVKPYIPINPHIVSTRLRENKLGLIELLPTVTLPADLINNSTIKELLDDQPNPKEIDWSSEKLFSYRHLLLLKDYWNALRGIKTIKPTADSLIAVGKMSNFLGNQTLTDFVTKQIADRITNPEVLEKKPDWGIKLLNSLDEEITLDDINREIGRILYDKYFDIIASALQQLLPKKPKKTLFHGDAIRSINITSDDKIIISGGCNNKVISWDINTGKSLKTLMGPTRAIAAPDNNIITAHSETMNLRDIDFNVIQTFKNTDPDIISISSIAVTPDRQRIVSGTHGLKAGHPIGSIDIWDINSGKRIEPIQNKWPIESIAITSHGEKIFYSDSSGTITIVDVATKSLNEGAQSNTHVTLKAYLDDQIIVGQDNGNLNILDSNGSKLKKHFVNDSPIYAIDTISFNQHIVSGGSAIKIWHPAFAQIPITIFEYNRTTGIHCTSLAVTPDGTKIIAGSTMGHIDIWDISSLQKSTHELYTMILKAKSSSLAPVLTPVPAPKLSMMQRMQAWLGLQKSKVKNYFRKA